MVNLRLYQSSSLPKLPYGRLALSVVIILDNCFLYPHDFQSFLIKSVRILLPEMNFLFLFVAYLASSYIKWSCFWAFFPYSGLCFLHSNLSMPDVQRRLPIIFQYFTLESFISRKKFYKSMGSGKNQKTFIPLVQKYKKEILLKK